MSLLPPLFSSTLGIELEFNTPSGGIPDKDPPRCWEAKEEHTGVEVVSASYFRSGPSFERNLDALLAWAEEHTNGVHDCGIHVHLGIPKRKQKIHRDDNDWASWDYDYFLLPDAYKRFMLVNERFFFYLVPPGRALGYNPPWMQSTVTALQSEFYANQPAWLKLQREAPHFRGMRAVGQATNLASAVKNYSIMHEDRLWFHGISDHGTCENRLLQGTYNKRTIVGWVALCDFVHRKAMTNTLPKTGVLETDTREQVFSKVISALNPPRPLKRWLENQYAYNDIARFA